MASPLRIKSCLSLQTRDRPKANSKLINVIHYLKGHPELFIATVIISVGLIISVIMLSIDPYFLTNYADGVNHLVIARRVFDTLTPGLVQLGGVWLPITHLLMMPFVANDFLFHTGLAGTIVSLAATAITAVALFRILQLHFVSSTIGVFGSFLFFLNPSVIYMGIIPMMEALFMMFFMLSVYYIQKWYFLCLSQQKIWIQYRTILKCALAVLAASLTRYEGWALPLGLIFVVPLVQFFIVGKKWGEREKHQLQALLSVALIFGFIGITAWVAWNIVIFKDPTYFLTGPYSAGAQADSREYNQQYKFNAIVSASLIFDAAKQMYGLPVLAISFFGIGLYLYSGIKRKRLRFSLLTVLMLMTPIVVDFGAMVQGSGEIVRIGDSWFNGRYLIFIAPLLAFGSASLLNSVMEATRSRRRSWKALTIIMSLLIAGSYTFTFASQTFEYGKAVALNDTGLLESTEAFQIARETGKQLERIYQGGNILLFTLSESNGLIMIESQISLRNFIDSTNGKYWDVSKESPWIYGDYLVLQSKFETSQELVDLENRDPLKDTGQYWYDPLRDMISNWHTTRHTLLEHYDLIYQNDRFEIFKRK